MAACPEYRQWALDALSDVYDPCCREKGISVVDMGLVRSVRENGGEVRVELLLTSGWCPFAARVLTEIKDRIEAQPGVTAADVQIVWDEAWTTDRLSPGPPAAAVPAATLERARPRCVRGRPPARERLEQP